MSKSSSKDAIRQADVDEASHDLRHAASHAGEAVAGAVESARKAGNGFGRDVKRSTQDVIDALDARAPGAAELVRASAEVAEDLGRRLRDGHVPDVAATLGGFASRQPAIFVGCGVLAGFIIAQLLPSSR